MEIGNENRKLMLEVYVESEVALCSTFLVRLKEHLRNANVPGLDLGGGLEEIDRTYVVYSSNERSSCTD